MPKKQGINKERKLQRKLEAEKFEESYRAIKIAAEVSDYLNQFPALRTFDGLGLKAELKAFHSKDISADTREWAFQLCKQNMKDLYNTAWGWSDKRKLVELKAGEARFIVAYIAGSDKESRPIAFVHFRFEIEDGIPVLYLHEIQLEEVCQRKGLGKALMVLVELIALRLQMHSVMLTVMKANKPAVTLYEHLKYRKHPSSPDNDENGTPGYIILYKPLRVAQH